ncbi:hypothetical protein N9N67_00745 [Bacteriovoracaceae bacterium]|nr:hypothetical protein [Bacteriovoracaceae bacterium]
MKLILIALLGLSLNVFSQSKDEADALWQQRGDDLNNAKLAAEMYEEVSKTVSTELTAAKLLLDASNAYYIYADYSKGKNLKKKFHTKGMNVAIRAQNLIKDTEEKALLALAYYRHGINLGKWGKANGVASSIKKAPKLRSLMKKVIKMGFESMEFYGAHRTLGKLDFEIPKPLGGSKKRAYKALKIAFDNTQDESGVASVLGTNNLYLADSFSNRGKKEEAIKILKGFLTLDPSIIPGREFETKAEMEIAKEKLEKLSK